MSELQRHTDTQAAQAAEREQQLEQRRHINIARSRERSQGFIDIATQKGLGKTALYIARSIIRPKKSTFFKSVDLSGRYPTNDVTYEYGYVDSGWVIRDGDESGPEDKIILPSNNVYACSVPHPSLKVPKAIEHVPYVTTEISEHGELIPLEAPFYNPYGRGGEEGGLLILEAALRRVEG